MSDGRVSLLPLYVSTRVGAQIVGGLFLLAAATSWIAVGYDFTEIRLFSSIGGGASVDPGERLGHSYAGQLLTTVQIISALAVACGFVVWLHRARANVRAFGVRRLRFARHWTVIGFLIPVLNTFRPLQVVREVWQASDPATRDALGWKANHVPTFVTLWWIALVGWVSLELLSGFVIDLAAGLEHIQLGWGLGLTADLCAALAASLGYFVVVRLAEAQDAKHAAWLGDARDAGSAPSLDPRDVPA
jgi:Domain of unknown function (DUF4328)